MFAFLDKDILEKVKKRIKPELIENEYSVVKNEFSEYKDFVEVFKDLNDLLLDLESSFYS